MGLRKCFIMALSSIMTSKMRSFLTMLGIIIGVGAVIILVSLMNGMTNEVTQTFEDMGTNTLTVTIRSRGNTKHVDADEMYEFVEEHKDLFSELSPTVSVSPTVKYEDNNVSSSVTGVSESYASIKDLDLQSGRFLQYIDIDRMQKVCVIGTYISKEFFAGESPVGKYIKINGEKFEIVGLLEERGDSTSGSADNCVYVPYTTAARSLSGSNIINNYTISVIDKNNLDEPIAVVKEMLSNKIGDSDYYTVVSMQELVDTMVEMMDMMQTVLICIAGISLLVGGIGIMNIMLVSVTERTREIGIRKSLGAKKKDIMRQFVIEAGTVSSLGGIIGIVFGVIMAGLFGKLVNLTAVPTPGAVLLAFGVSVGIGVVFGLLPARKAAKLNPIDALRYE